MAGKAPRGGRNGLVKQRAHGELLLRLAGRVTVGLFALLLFSLAAVQFARLIDRNLLMGRELKVTQNEVAALDARRAKQIHDVRRLENSAGAIPEIHARLRMVGPHEELIYVRPAPSTAP